MENQGRAVFCSNLDPDKNNVVGPLSANPQKQQQTDHPKPNQDHNRLSLVDTNDPAKAQRDSMENHANEAGSSKFGRRRERQSSSEFWKLVVFA